MNRMIRMCILLVVPLVARAAGPAIVPTQPDVIKPPHEVGGLVFPRQVAKTVTFNLEAKEVVAEIAPGKNFWFWTFAEVGKKATVPGPLLRVMQGDTVVINLTNLLINPMSGNKEPHNIDFHAAMGPGGGAAVTNVEPGQTATMTFKATRAGTYIYHCAGEGYPWEHVAHGMYGAIVVEPPGGLPPFDREYYVGQADWYLEPSAVPLGDAGNVTGGAATYHNVDDQRAEDERPNLFTFNGHKTALVTNPLRAVQNDRVRIFFVNGGPNIISNFHVIGQIFDKVAVGLPRANQYQMNEETMSVSPGSAAMFEMDTLVPGKYLLVDHSLFRVPKGAGGFLVVEPAVPGVWPSKLFSPAPPAGEW